MGCCSPITNAVVSLGQSKKMVNITPSSADPDTV